ncbi:SOS response-associated peptidase family protein [Qipengyuania sp. JC766]|uniref:SOS response-associated peptidase n=1 Tax=Qipengyuania sp. JC766 TaxID=3232139 RepID=UPI00345B18B3
MCNLYRMTRNVDEVARLFDITGASGANFADEVYPGYPGLVVLPDRIASMVWGFPLQRKGAKGQPLKPKPINNARTDKLGGGFWRSSFESRRCLIPMDAFAEAEGPAGGKTRTWFRVPDRPLFACAGIWRNSDEWGESYSLVMTEASAAVDGVHDRMPVILSPEGESVWLGADPQAALGLCRPWEGPLSIERTAEPWTKSRKPEQPSLL